MLSPQELLEYKNKPVLDVYSLGQKESELPVSEFGLAQLEMKLDNIEKLLSIERVKMIGMLSKAVWCPDLKKAKVLEQQGPYWGSMGHSLNSNMYLNSEEALYLIDIGALELKFNDVPLSLQRAYFLLLHNTDITMDQYRVFSHLSVLGYKVMRHSDKNVLTKYEKNIEIHKIGIKQKNVSAMRHKRVAKSVSSEEIFEDDPVFPIHLSSEDSEDVVMGRLQKIGPVKVETTNLEVMTAIIDYDVFLPTTEKTQFKKSTVQLPDYRICVTSFNDLGPDFDEICKLKKNFEDEVPLIHAVVHPDFINFLQIEPVSLPILLKKNI